MWKIIGGIVMLIVMAISFFSGKITLDAFAITATICMFAVASGCDDIMKKK